MSKFRTSRAVVIITTVLSLACTGSWIATQQVTASAASSCSEVLFIGVRGSGQAAGLGATVQDVYNVFDARTTRSITAYALPYTAAPVPVLNKGASVTAFINSVNSGKTMLVNEITARAAECPSQKIVVAGYSQGALVVTQAMRTLAVPLLNRINGIALEADPVFDPTFSGNVGTYAKNDEGIVSTFTSIYKAQEYLPATVASRAKSYCLAYDPVCNYSVVSLTNCLWSGSRCAHNQYVSKGYTRQGGEFLARRV